MPPALPRNKLAIALYDRRDWDAAVAEFRTTIELDPGFAYAYNNLGNALRRTGNSEGAIAAYKVAIQLDPNYAVPHNNLGNALRSQGKQEEAIAAYRAAIALDPSYMSPRVGLGLSLSDGKELDAAIAEYRAGLEINPSNTTRLHNNPYRSGGNDSRHDKIQKQHAKGAGNIGQHRDPTGAELVAAGKVVSALDVDDLYRDAGERQCVLLER